MFSYNCIVSGTVSTACFVESP